MARLASERILSEFSIKFLGSGRFRVDANELEEEEEKNSFSSQFEKRFYFVRFSFPVFEWKFFVEVKV